MLAVPMPTAVTIPLDETVATARLLEVQLIGRVPSATVASLPSLPVTAARVVCASCSAASVSVTLTVASTPADDVTVIAIVPLTLPTPAVIVAEPALTPVTSPDAFTVATAAALVVHEAFGDELDDPSLNLATAESCTVCCVRIVALGALTSTRVIVGGCVGGGY